MKVAWSTNLHLNLVSDEEVRSFRREIGRQAPKALLLAGDIAEAGSLDKYLLLLGGTLGVPVYFVLGNSDYYGSRISNVRESMRQLTRRDPTRFGWMPAVGVLELTSKTALIGVDGWGDASVGNYNTTKVEPEDWKKIDDLKFLDKTSRFGKLRALGLESADLLRKLLDQALAKYSRVLVLTHVPPFKEACWNEDEMADDDWLPWYTCRQVGDALLNAAEKNQDKQIDVYCGHMLGGGTTKPRPNLTVYTGCAPRGKPTSHASIDID